MKANGNLVTYENVRVFMKECIHTMNARMKWKMKLSEYTPHSLRVGGCVDMARNGDAGMFIEQQVRWASKVWKTIYLNLDWRDISIISGLSITDLKRCNRRPFVE